MEGLLSTGPTPSSLYPFGGTYNGRNIVVYNCNFFKFIYDCMHCWLIVVVFFWNVYIGHPLNLPFHPCRQMVSDYRSLLSNTFSIRQPFLKGAVHLGFVPREAIKTMFSLLASQFGWHLSLYIWLGAFGENLVN